MSQELKMLTEIITGLKNYQNSGAGLIRIFQNIQAEGMAFVLKGFLECGESTRNKLSADSQKMIMNCIDIATFQVVEDHHEEILTLQLKCDQQLLKVFGIDCQEQIVKNLLPGCYTLQISTDWVIWEGHLTDAELLWAYAYPEQDLPMAAATGEADKILPKTEINLLDGQLKLEIFPGLEAGAMKIIVS